MSRKLEFSYLKSHGPLQHKEGTFFIQLLQIMIYDPDRSRWKCMPYSL